MEIFVYDERGRVDNNRDDDGETMIAYKLDVIRIEIKAFSQYVNWLNDSSISKGF